MNYVFILFDSNGKVTDIRTFTPDAVNDTVKHYAKYIGLDVVVSEAVYRGSGAYANMRGVVAVVLGPYADEDQMFSLASIAKAIALNVDTALSLSRATGDGA